MKTREKTRDSTATIQKQLQIDRQGDIEFQNILIEERDKEIQGLATQIQDVNELYKQIAVIVDEQGEQVNRVTDNIEVSFQQVENAKKEIDEANETAKKSSCVLV